jgi:Ser/Thr protein kinase RdoA (MazF antagonist)
MQIPSAVRLAFGLAGSDNELDIEHVPSLINATFIVRPRGAAEPLVLQRLHPVFGATVHVDIEAVTKHLAARGMITPRLIHTRDGALWFEDVATDGARRVWRALSYVDGLTIHKSDDAVRLESAAALLGRFHSTLGDLQHEFVHHRALHDTPRHLANLEAALRSARGQQDAEALALGERVLEQARSVRVDFGALPLRVIHGDPKLSNVMFERERPESACCMIDLDTVSRGSLASELGDALRSWCNPAGEDSQQARVEPASFAAVVRGYARTCSTDVSRAELLSIVDGLMTISVELASRFAADAINDSYFGWDASRYASRREHNLVRAGGQLALSLAVRGAHADLERVVDDAFEHVLAPRAR